MTFFFLLFYILLFYSDFALDKETKHVNFTFIHSNVHDKTRVFFTLILRKQDLSILFSLQLKKSKPLLYIFLKLIQKHQFYSISLFQKSEKMKLKINKSTALVFNSFKIKKNETKAKKKQRNLFI